MFRCLQAFFFPSRKKQTKPTDFIFWNVFRSSSQNWQVEHDNLSQEKTSIFLMISKQLNQSLSRTIGNDCNSPASSVLLALALCSERRDEERINFRIFHCFPSRVSLARLDDVFAQHRGCKLNIIEPGLRAPKWNTDMLCAVPVWCVLSCKIRLFPFNMITFPDCIKRKNNAKHKTLPKTRALTIRSYQMEMKWTLVTRNWLQKNHIAKGNCVVNSWPRRDLYIIPYRSEKLCWALLE